VPVLRTKEFHCCWRHVDVHLEWNGGNDRSPQISINALLGMSFLDSWVDAVSYSTQKKNACFFLGRGDSGHQRVPRSNGRSGPRAAATNTTNTTARKVAPMLTVPELQPACRFPGRSGSSDDYAGSRGVKDHQRFCSNNNQHPVGDDNATRITINVF